MGTSSALVSDLLVAAITGRTGVGANVFSPRTRRTTAAEMPVILVQSPTERKENAAGRTGAPQFHVKTVIRLVARMTARATADESGAMALLGALGVLQGQIEIAAINDYELRRVIQQYSAVEVTANVTREGEQLFGELVMDFEIEFYQGPEDFAPNVADAMAEFAIYADLVNIYSPTGVFAGTPFAGDATAPPRTEGPDGRPEGLLLVTLPQ